LSLTPKSGERGRFAKVSEPIAPPGQLQWFFLQSESNMFYKAGLKPANTSVRHKRLFMTDTAYCAPSPSNTVFTVRTITVKSIRIDMFFK
jgi:hypothetical protein